MKGLRPGTQKIGFLVESYLYSLIPGSKLANPGQNTSNFNNGGGYQWEVGVHICSWFVSQLFGWHTHGFGMFFRGL